MGNANFFPNYLLRQNTTTNYLEISNHYILRNDFRQRINHSTNRYTNIFNQTSFYLVVKQKCYIK